MATLVWSNHYCDGDCVYLCHNTCLVLFGVSHHKHTLHIWNSCNFMWQEHKNCVNYNLWHLLKNNWNADRLMNRRCSSRSYHMTESKMDLGGGKHYCKIKNMNNTENKIQNFGTDYIFQPAQVLTHSKVTSDDINDIWYTVWDKLVICTVHIWKICQRVTTVKYLIKDAPNPKT